MPATEDMQTIPARHGTATFVPKGSTIKIVNTSGTQVIDTWAFVLPNPPKKPGPRDEENKEEESEEKGKPENAKAEEEEKRRKEEEEKKNQEEEEKKKQEGSKAVTKKNRKSKGSLDLPSQEDAEKATRQMEQQAAEQALKSGQQSTPTKAGWSSYLPSLRGRKQVTDESAAPSKTEAQDTAAEQAQQKENSRTWGSYLTKGQAVTSYLPSKGAISAFAASHARDTSKSYAEQLADFSKTPVGAASISAITGSGTASSLYAGYSAWNSIHGDSVQNEYLSLPHTRATTYHMIPRVNDVLVSNIREPMLTLVEDTSNGIHDTLIAACDPQRYRALGVENWEEHGSCAENLVLALKELNERAGLKGPKGVGAAVTVNSVPAPLNLFMNIPWKGDKGDLSFAAPKGKEGDYVRFRAERDVVVVMSACPNDVQDINGKESKDGHFIVEHPDSDSDSEDEAAEAKKPEPKKKGNPRKLNSAKKDDSKSDDGKKGAKKDEAKKDDSKPEEQKKAENVPLPSTPAAEKSDPTSAAKPKPKPKPEEQKKAENVPLPSTPAAEKSDPAASAPAAKPKAKPKKLVDPSTGEKKKPKKLEKRGTPASGAGTPKSQEGKSQPKSEGKSESKSEGKSKGDSGS